MALRHSARLLHAALALTFGLSVPLAAQEAAPAAPTAPAAEAVTIPFDPPIGTPLTYALRFERKRQRGDSVVDFDQRLTFAKAEGGYVLTLETLSFSSGGQRFDLADRRALVDMPSWLYSDLAPADVDALVTYLKTLPPRGEAHPEPVLGPALLALQAKGEWMDSAARVTDMNAKGPPDLGKSHAYGRFIIRATCVECHGIELKGGEGPMEGDGNPPPNLRIVGSYSAADFTTLMRTGTAASGREVGLMSKVARRRYANFTDAEVAAVRGYLVELANRDP